MSRKTIFFSSLLLILLLAIGISFPTNTFASEANKGLQELTLEFNHAFKKNVEYSGVEGGKSGGNWTHPHLAGESALDGDMNSRWSAAKEDTQWLTIDLGEEIELGKILIHFHTPSPDYEIEISNDNENFKSVINETGIENIRITMDHDLSGNSARYVRYKQNKLAAHANGREYGSSIFLFEVYDNSSFNNLENINKEDTFIVGSFNIAAALSPNIFVQSKQAHKHHIDIVGLQEVDKYTDRTRYDLLNSFSSLRFPHNAFSRSIDYQNGEYGNGVASKHLLLESTQESFPIYNGTENRSLQRVLINKDGRKIAFYNTHLSFENPYVRRRQMEILKDRMVNDPAEYVLATGDFNITELNEYDIFLDEFNIANGHNGNWFDTFNGSEGKEQVRAIDNIIASKNLEIENVGVDTTKLSDHYLLYAEFKFLDIDNEAKKAAEQVDQLIDNLLQVSDLKLEDKEQIVEVRTAYDNLSAEAKKLVLKLVDLEAREDRLVDLENAAAAEGVDLLIAQFKEGDEVTEEYRAKVLAASEAYDALTEEQKAFVHPENIGKLERAEVKISDADDTLNRQGWIEEDSGWYYYDVNGNMQTGWAKENNTWYYLNKDGLMQTGWTKVNNTWYYLADSGAMRTGWMKVNNTWYYLDNTGAMQTGWTQVNNTWYYLADSGAMRIGWTKFNNTWYYLDNTGAMQTGWLKLGNAWYYLNTDGSMQIDNTTINGVQYQFDASGKML